MNDNRNNSKRLKIAIVIDVFNGAKTGGVISAQRFVKLLREKHDVTVVTSGESEEGNVILPSFRVPFAHRIMREMGFSFAVPVTSVLRETFARMDVVHVQFPFLLGIQSVKIAKTLGVPVVSSFLVQPENIFYNIGIRSEKLINRTYRLFVNQVFNRSHAVVCPSHFARSELDRFGLKRPGYVISNGILPQFRPVPTTRTPWHRQRFVILSVGRLARDKRLDVLIKAIAHSRYKDTIQLIMVGRGPIKGKLMKLGRMLPNPPLFLSVSEEELIRHYNAADLFVHPSEVELEGMAVLEALACGLPALISDSKTNASRQFILNEKFMFSSNDPVDLSAKIDYFIRNRDELIAARQEYLEMSKRFQIDKSVRELERVYFKVQEHRRGNGTVISGKL